ncbi:MAG: hypothetical protein L6R35_007616, partial [Caloplaca aegaea]
MISQARQVTLHACKTEVNEINDLLRLLHQLRYPEDRFLAFLRRTSEGSADLVEVLEAGPSELDEKLEVLAAAADASGRMAESFRLSITDRSWDDNIWTHLTRAMKNMLPAAHIRTPVSRHSQTYGFTGYGFGGMTTASLVRTGSFRFRHASRRPSQPREEPSPSGRSARPALPAAPVPSSSQATNPFAQITQHRLTEQAGQPPLLPYQTNQPIDLSQLPPPEPGGVLPGRVHLTRPLLSLIPTVPAGAVGPSPADAP